MLAKLSILLSTLKIIALIILTGFMLFGCSAEKRLSRLLAKNPSLIESDTVFFRDTIIVGGVQNDTVFSLQRILMSKDTIVIQKDRLTQKIFYNRDSIYVYGECASDTIYKENYRVVEKFVGDSITWKDYLIIFCMIIGVFIFFKLLFIK
jgi:hypothetical protein